MKPGAILASNTSSLKLEDLRTVLARPERLVGIHFFNPVAMMPLVEVVEADGADPAAVRAACAFVKQIDKLPLPVRSAPGFLVNAVLAPRITSYNVCYTKLLRESLAPAKPDEAALGLSYDQIDDFLEGREIGAEAAARLIHIFVTTAHKREPIASIYDQ